MHARCSGHSGSVVHSGLGAKMIEHAFLKNLKPLLKSPKYYVRYMRNECFAVFCNRRMTAFKFIIPSLLLTQFAASLWIPNVTIRACTYRFMPDDFTYSTWSARVSNSTRINTLSIFTCSIIWAVSIRVTSNIQSWLSWKTN